MTTIPASMVATINAADMARLARYSTDTLNAVLRTEGVRSGKLTMVRMILATR